mgnify:CR=1
MFSVFFCMGECGSAGVVLLIKGSYDLSTTMSEDGGPYEQRNNNS